MGKVKMTMMDARSHRKSRDPEEPRSDEVSQEELEAELARELPDREALSVLDANVAIPADPTIAADVLAGEDPPEEPPDS
jgi:hypothetical protein